MIKPVYTLYDKDSGMISQSNIVYNDEKGAYGKILREREQTFINHAGDSYASLDKHFVNKKKLTARPEFGITAETTSIKASKEGGVVLRGIPKGVRIELYVIVGGRKHLIQSEQFDGPEIEVPFDTPGMYAIAFTKHPFRRWETIVEVSE